MDPVSNSNVPEQNDARQKNVVRETMIEVIHSLNEKGYDAINQMVGYIVSDDPTFITNYQNARSKLSRFTRDEILEELLYTFLEANQV